MALVQEQDVVDNCSFGLGCFFPSACLSLCSGVIFDQLFCCIWGGTEKRSILSLLLTYMQLSLQLIPPSFFSFYPILSVSPLSVISKTSTESLFGVFASPRLGCKKPD